MVAALGMPHGLPTTLRVVDWAMILYWGCSALAALGIIALPKSLMYAGYGTPIIDAWNWSFAPLDLIFSVLGLLGLKLAARGNARWRPVVLSSLTLTFCAGLMATAFWAIRGDVDPAWWIPNLALMAVGLWWAPRLISAEPTTI